ncbi:MULTISPECIES: NUDIX domain-containing protein [unclassified Bacillus (in: firmicutes)]|uniref:NUDIX domain-containing protein n=1 Tax=unclassified Bacillus (in: firmicutes) TaxID=185979 RepID=UPI0008EC54D6|nr:MULTISPECIES: NUDIX domain-containing protein [unclassified Bacillus (in: firmicutes)]SFB11663.1 ADP-ribose pyrophosphatase YjhB, NUDIX family [Bacillus sp. UNCCL13]SFQ90473.1 ADP-ribose pyrophosphatase YjhB, NUDIX family [Bacillus sp. cl95]
MTKYNTEQEVLAHYDSSKYLTPDGYVADIAIFTIVSDKVEEKAPPKMTLKLMLIKRAEKDSEGNANIEGGKWALPGGFVDAIHKETALMAAKRELKEETNVDGLLIKHFGVYDEVERDPRGWMISNAFYAIVPEQLIGQREANDDAADIELFDVEEVFQLDLAFDHRKIIKDALTFIKRDMVQTTLAKNFLPEEFTLSELQRVLLTVGEDSKISSDPVFFAKAPKLPFLEKVLDEEMKPKKTNRNSFRPSQLYRFNDFEIIESIYN